MGMEADEPRKKKANTFNSGENTNFKLQSFLRNPGGAQPDDDSDPIIADLFTETTVIFADIAGFTAWSSLREPAMVFKLLETLYGTLHF
jgi:class 3 adenylate cyclase